MGVLSFFGAIMWKDVREMRQNRITRADLEAATEKANVERAEKHVETMGNFRRLEDQTTDNFRRLEEKLEQVEDGHHKSALAIEQRIGQVLVEVAKIRPHRTDGPERRRF